ncbi:hypothetical protein ACIQAC_07675 [Streptomyces sp. NPDC088387]|uniref:hypothetical protein n=1 Tax=Streptomyces sp. NPDC088387 TaxID=3365859 RepID=UPI00380E829D
MPDARREANVQLSPGGHRVADVTSDPSPVLRYRPVDELSDFQPPYFQPLHK